MSKGKKFDQEKPRTDLIPPSAIFDIAEVLTHGADKYGDRNWEQGLEFSRLFGAVQRHLWDWYRGNNIDDDSGLNHLKHALTSLAMLNHMRYIHPELDDRPSQPKGFKASEFENGYSIISTDIKDIKVTNNEQKQRSPNSEKSD